MKRWYIWALSVVYPIVLFFLIWLFFLSEELLSISDILSGLFVVGGFGFIGVIPLGIIIDIVKPSIIQHLIKVIMWIQIIVFGLMVSVPILSIFLVPMCVAIYHMCISFPVLCIIAGMLLFVVICLTLYIKFGLKKGLLHYPVLRTIYYRLSQILPVYVWAISLFFIPHTFDMESNIPGYGACYLIVACAFVLYYIFFGDNGESVYYITIPHLKYNFFLRPFFMDNSLTIDKEIKKNFPECELVEIADPITKKGNINFTGRSLFLPTNDWKRELSYYIKKAQLVFCCIGTSDGVKWEMFEHDAILDKYIFYYDGSTSIQEIVQGIRLKKYMNSKMFSLLKSTQKHSLICPLYFIVRGNNCYYSTKLSCIASFIKEGISTGQIYSFAFEHQEEEMTQRSNAWRTNIVYYFKDLVRVLSIIVRPKSLFDLLKALGCLVVILFLILLILMGIGLIISGIASLVSFLLPSFQQEIMYALEGLVETPRQLFFQSIGEIVTGIAILRMIIDKD